MSLSTSFLPSLPHCRYKAIFSTHDDRVISTVNRSIEASITNLSDAASTLVAPDALRAFLVLLMNPLNGLPKRGSALGRLCTCITSLPAKSQGLLLHWIAVDVPPELFASRLVRVGGLRGARGSLSTLSW